ncbi:MAG: hypothetical protein Q7S58_14960 [Candidatus Binatus sp.]|uniref:hypothetical protein n=1 Tax=Candidatus Binatus sp. TaxID=2811406 RepID=UPI00271CAD3B|nr:hypothetical protein [Candidatus Binatus sp.]MDO8433702.1 hypothetical protein [Candidatus Binatus sp.]
MTTRRRLILMFVLTALVVAIGVVANYLFNPYGAWRSAWIDPIFRRVEHERVVMPYLLRTAQPETVLLGSSRVYMGMHIEQGERDGFLNAALSGATISQLARELDVALANPRLKRIIWGVDFFAFDRKWKRHDSNFDRRIAGSIALKFEDTLLSLDTLGDGYKYYGRARRGAKKLPPTMTAAMPWPMAMICRQFKATRDHGLHSVSAAEVEEQLAQDLPAYSTYRFSSDTMKQFREAVDHARKRGVEVIPFVPPFSQYELELIRQGGQWETFQNFKRELASVAPFWDFSGYNLIARTDELFMHVMHFKVAAGQMMLRIVLGEKDAPCDEQTRAIIESAMYVNGANVERALAEQDRMRGAASSVATRYSKLAAAAIVRRGQGHLEIGEDRASR